MQFHPRGILLKWLPIYPHIKRLRNVSLGLLRLFWCAFKKPVWAEGAHSQLTRTQWLHLSLKVNTIVRGGPQIWPFQMPRPPRLSILCDNEQIPIQKHLLCDSVALWCLQHTWVNEWTTSLMNKARLQFTRAVNVTSVYDALELDECLVSLLENLFDTLKSVQSKDVSLGIKIILSWSIVWVCASQPVLSDVPLQPRWSKHPYINTMPILSQICSYGWITRWMSGPVVLMLLIVKKRKRDITMHFTLI